MTLICPLFSFMQIVEGCLQKNRSQRRCADLELRTVKRYVSWKTCQREEEEEILSSRWIVIPVRTKKTNSALSLFMMSWQMQRKILFWGISSLPFSSSLLVCLLFVTPLLPCVFHHGISRLWALSVCITVSLRFRHKKIGKKPLELTHGYINFSNSLEWWKDKSTVILPLRIFS